MGHPSSQVNRGPTGCFPIPPPGHYPASRPAERESDKKKKETFAISKVILCVYIYLHSSLFSSILMAL